MSAFFNFAPSKIQLLDIIPLGRASSYFIQGFFDGHPQCITIPDQIIYKLISDNWVKKDFKEIINLIYEESILSIFGVHNNLFEKKISKEIFKRNIEEYLDYFGVTRKNIFIAIHYAIARIIYPQNVSTIKYIVYQNHAVYYHFFNNFIVNIQDDFPERKVLFMARDPRASWYSIKTRCPYSRLPFFNCMTSYTYSQYFFKKYPTQALFIRHEDFHCDFENQLKRITAFMDIEAHPSSHFSSFYSIPYDGKVLSDNKPSSITGIFKNRPDPCYVKDDWQKNLAASEILILQLFYRSYMRQFHYKFYFKKDGLFNFYNFFPCRKRDFRDLQGVKSPTTLIFSYVVRLPIIGNIIVFLIFACLYLMWYLSGKLYLWKIWSV